MESDVCLLDVVRSSEAAGSPPFFGEPFTWDLHLTLTPASRGRAGIRPRPPAATRGLHAPTPTVPQQHTLKYICDNTAPNTLKTNSESNYIFRTHTSPGRKATAARRHSAGVSVHNREAKVHCREARVSGTPTGDPWEADDHRRYVVAVVPFLLLPSLRRLEHDAIADGSDAAALHARRNIANILSCQKARVITCLRTHLPAYLPTKLPTQLDPASAPTPTRHSTRQHMAAHGSTMQHTPAHGSPDVGG
jgi:hypothetical protein